MKIDYSKKDQGFTHAVQFLNCKKNFTEDVKYFKSYDKAVSWGLKTFDKFSTDYITFL